MFYVYRHLRSDSSRPFYVGKGLERNDRAHRRQGRNRYWHNIAQRGYRVDIIARFDREDYALAFESKLIRLYKQFGFCEANFVDYDVRRSGSSGHTWTLASRAKAAKAKLGTVLSTEHRRKIGEAHIGARNGFYGKVHSEETRKFVSNHHKQTGRFVGACNPAARSVVDTQSGIIYKTLKDAARFTEIPLITVSRHCRNQVKSPRFRYEEVNGKSHS